MGLGGRAGRPPRERAFCPRPEEPPQGLTRCSHRLRLEKGLSPGWFTAEEAGGLSPGERPGPGERRSGLRLVQRQQGWRQMDAFGCILKVSLMGLPEELLREVGPGRLQSTASQRVRHDWSASARTRVGGKGQREVTGCGRFCLSDHVNECVRVSGLG